MVRGFCTIWSNFRRPHVLSKLLVLIMASITLGLYFPVYPWLFNLGNHHQMVLVHLTCGAMLTITGVTWLCHVVGQDTPRLVSMVYSCMGAALFSAVGGVCLAAWGRRGIADTHEPIPGFHVNGFLRPEVLLATGVFGTLSSAAYLGDFFVTRISRP